MKKFILFAVVCLFSMNCVMAQNVVKCQKQTKLESEKSQLVKLYGSDYVTQALEGEITEGMPEKLLLKAFNTQEVKQKSGNNKVFEIYDDKILYPRSPGQKEPTPIYVVTTSKNKVVKIESGEENEHNYKKEKGVNGVVFH